jgi:hypothetical protein
MPESAYRVCFVVMPFSATKSCTEEEWTRIFEEIFKPAIEGAGLGYDCRRSTATRGNIVAGIVRDLNDAYVVLADLTDRNANVFYELGVRHALTNRTIIIAQDRGDIPFDLGNYASHVYEWRSEKGKEELTRILRELLREIDTNPERPDNPVSDFLEDLPVRSLPTKTTDPPAVSTASISSLVGPGSEELDIPSRVRVLVKRDPTRAAKAVRRKTRPALIQEVSAIVRKLNEGSGAGSLQETEIPIQAQKHIAVGEPVMQNIELFALTAVEVDWREGVKESIGFAGDLITISESPVGGRNIRFATGLPALLAWRLLILMGAKALSEEAYDLVDLIINDPIESEKHGRFVHRPLRDRRNLFYSEAFLGYANFTALYLRDLWDKHPHIQNFFESKEVFEFSMAQFLMLVALANAVHNDDQQFYPGYRLLPEAQASRAMSALSSRLRGRPDYRDKIAKIIGFKDGATLEAEWATLAAKANQAKLGQNYWDSHGLRFPTQLGEAVSPDY